ncbi:hypothetical protein ACS0TY_014225 [Phlomoides rotata]
MLLQKVKHLILLSETPSLSRRGLLEQTKFEFVKTYCNVKLVRGCQEKLYQVSLCDSLFTILLL